MQCQILHIQCGTAFQIDRSTAFGRTVFAVSEIDRIVCVGGKGRTVFQCDGCGIGGVVIVNVHIDTGEGGICIVNDNIAFALPVGRNIKVCTVFDFKQRSGSVVHTFHFNISICTFDFCCVLIGSAFVTDIESSDGAFAFQGQCGISSIFSIKANRNFAAHIGIGQSSIGNHIRCTGQSTDIQ